MEQKKKSVFETLNAVNVNDNVEKKDNGQATLTYLSWVWAWTEVKKRYPDASYEVRHWDGRPYLQDDRLGFMVETSVTIDGETLPMWLPVMDSRNKAMRYTPYTYKTRNAEKTVEAATMYDINTAIMRCLVKNLAIFGLGLYIYAGEDLPEEEANAVKDAAAKLEEEAVAAMMAVKSRDELDACWREYSVKVNHAMGSPFVVACQRMAEKYPKTDNK